MPKRETAVFTLRSPRSLKTMVSGIIDNHWSGVRIQKLLKGYWKNDGGYLPGEFKIILEGLFRQQGRFMLFLYGIVPQISADSFIAGFHDKYFLIEWDPDENHGELRTVTRKEIIETMQLDDF